MKKRSGFTLAEVLITLGIIGVVAAMTIPTLIQNTNSVKFASQFKKTLSTLSQAGLMAQAQYELDYAGVRTASAHASCATQTVAAGNYTMCGIFNNTLAGKTYMGVYGQLPAADGSTPTTNAQTGATEGGYSIATTMLPSPTGYLVFALADGSYVGFNPNATGCALPAGTVLDEAILRQAQAAQGSTPEVKAGGLANCIGFIDVNGASAPNKEVTCQTPTDTKLDPSATPCEAASSGATMGDVFPVVFHDGSVEPATNAAKMVLTRSK